MSKIPTAEEFLLEHVKNPDLTSSFAEILIKFTKLHVEQALTEASKTTKWKEQITMQGLQISIIKSSILNAYPLENIK